MLHPVVLTLLQAVVVRGPKAAEAPATALTQARAELGAVAGKTAQPFLELAVAWARFDEAGCKPIAGQLLALLELYPALRAMQKDGGLRQAARALAAQAQTDSRAAIAALARPHGASVGLRPGAKAKPTPKL